MMCEKIMVARETAKAEENPNMVINGRTDALKTHKNREDGLNLAIERANQYLDAGADLSFIPYVATLEEVEIINREVKGPVSIAAGMPYNIKNFSIDDLRKLGVARVSLPSLLLLSSLESIKVSLKYLKDDRMIELVKEEQLFSYEDLNTLLNI
jgi:2-methylisocitrate lyase-like PEP mutase family enzyme